MSGCAVKDTEGLVVAVRAYRGPALGVGAAFDEVVTWADVYHLEQWGPLIGVYQDGDATIDPTLPGEGWITAEAWLPLPPGVSAPEGADPAIEVRVERPVQVASCLHRGFPDGVGRTLALLLRWVEERGLARASATHRQVYLSAPKGSPGDWEIEVQVPVTVPSSGVGP